MTVPLGHDLTPLAVIIFIKDLNGIVQYRYDMIQLSPGNPTQDFELKGGTLIAGINSDAGSLTIYINDNDELLTDKDDIQFPSFIKQGWEIELYAGKNEGNIHLWYRGIIDTVKTIKQTNTNTVTINSRGYGSLLASRYSSMNRTQIKLSDGITPDDTDLSTKATELIKDLLLDTDHLEVKGLGLLDIIPGDIDDLPFQLGDFRKNIIPISVAINELAQTIGAYWGVNPDKTLFLHQRNTKNSGLLITNDTKNPSLLTNNWDQEKVAFLKSSQLIRNDTSTDTAITSIIGIGSQRQTPDHKQEITELPLDLNLVHYAFRFTPQKDNISQITLAMTRGGIITSGITVSIVGSKPGTTVSIPNLDDVREVKIIPAELLEKELGTGDRFIDIKINKISTNDSKELFIVINQSPNPLNFLTLDYLTGATNNYLESTDLETWDDFEGDPAFITYQSKTVKIIGQNTTTQKFLRPKELLITYPDKPDEKTILAIIEAGLETKSKIRSNYDPILITPPTLPIKLGQCVKYIDVDSGFEADLDVVGYEFSFNAYGKNNLGASEIKLDLQNTYI